MQFIFISNVHGCIADFKQLDEEPSDERTLEPESAWSLLRETFECRDFDDSLVFSE